MEVAWRGRTCFEKQYTVPLREAAGAIRSTFPFTVREMLSVEL